MPIQLAHIVPSPDFGLSVDQKFRTGNLVQQDQMNPTEIESSDDTMMKLSLKSQQPTSRDLFAQSKRGMIQVQDVTSLHLCLILKGSEEANQDRHPSVFL